jgi:hypothetical protein
MNACACCAPRLAARFQAPAMTLPRRKATLDPSPIETPATTGPPEADTPTCAVLTVGHSTRPIEAFIELLAGHGVTQLIDIRTVPRSRHNPQFGTDALAETLTALHIGYAHAAALGGFRRPAPDSPNAGWRNLSFRGYADYMQTTDFAAALEAVIRLAETDRVALMCAEAVPWRCHRSLVADALLARDVPVAEIVSPKRLQAHRLTRFARVEGERITYPADAAAEADKRDALPAPPVPRTVRSRTSK